MNDTQRLSLNNHGIYFFSGLLDEIRDSGARNFGSLVELNVLVAETLFRTIICRICGL
jgi:hypothetical protein